MNQMKLEEILGKTLEITQMNITREGSQAILFLNTKIETKNISLQFNNVSGLQINDLNMPFQICGFEVIDNKTMGWEKSKRYKIHDFEDDRISFFCETITTTK